MSDLDILIDEYALKLEKALKIDEELEDELEYRSRLRNLLGEFANRILTEIGHGRQLQ